MIYSLGTKKHEMMKNISKIMGQIPIYLSKSITQNSLYEKREYRNDTPKIRGGDKGNRTPDLLNANQALYHLSYTPT